MRLGASPESGAEVWTGMLSMRATPHQRKAEPRGSREALAWPSGRLMEKSKKNFAAGWEEFAPVSSTPARMRVRSPEGVWLQTRGANVKTARSKVRIQISNYVCRTVGVSWEPSFKCLG